MSQDHWAKATENLARVQKHIEAQLKVLQRLRARGCDTSSALALLEVLLATNNALEESAEMFWAEHVLHEARVRQRRRSSSPNAPALCPKAF